MVSSTCAGTASATPRKTVSKFGVIVVELEWFLGADCPKKLCEWCKLSTQMFVVPFSRIWPGPRLIQPFICGKCDLYDFIACCLPYMTIRGLSPYPCHAVRAFTHHTVWTYPSDDCLLYGHNPSDGTVCSPRNHQPHAPYSPCSLILVTQYCTSYHSPAFELQWSIISNFCVVHHVALLT